MEVPFLDLKAQYAQIKNQVLAAVSDVLESQVCIGGPKIAELEDQIAALSGCQYAVGVSSGTDALLCSLMSLDIGPGDEVITTPFTFFGTAGAIARTGAKPVFVDIDPRTYNIDPALIERRITRQTKVIIPVHLYGQMAEMDPIMEVANRHGIPVIEDAAQAIGATYQGRQAGSIGAVACFSFYPTKNLGACGDAGMIVTNDARLRDRMSMMRNHGGDRKYFHRYVGGNFRLDPIQAAILLVKLPYLRKWSEARRQNAAYYDRHFRGTALRTPCVHPDCVSIYHQYVIEVDRREEMIAHLHAKGVGCEVYYPLSLDQQECFQRFGYNSESRCPKSSRAAGRVLALPVYPELTPTMQDYVIGAVREFVSR